jgi:hypothetical protein
MKGGPTFRKPVTPDASHPWFSKRDGPEGEMLSDVVVGWRGSLVPCRLAAILI